MLLQAGFLEILPASTWKTFSIAAELICIAACPCFSHKVYIMANMFGLTSCCRIRLPSPGRQEGNILGNYVIFW